MELNHLKYFYEVAKAQSFTRASRTLRVSQPSISKIIKQLEDRESVRLLDRTRRSVSLTPVGQVYFKKCELVFRELDELRQQVESQKKELVGSLSIGASDTLVNYLFPTVLKDLSSRHPRLEFKLFTGPSADIKTRLRDGSVDLGVFFTPPRESAFIAERISRVEFKIVCARESRVFHGDFADPKTLGAYPMLGCGGIEYSKSYPVLSMLRSLGIEPHFRIEATAQETQKRLAESDLGYAVLPEFMIQDELRQRKLKVLRTTRRIGADVHFVARRGRTRSALTKLFEERFRRELARL